MRWQLSKHVKQTRAETTQVFGARAVQAGNRASAESRVSESLRLENS